VEGASAADEIEDEQEEAVGTPDSRRAHSSRSCLIHMPTVGADRRCCHGAYRAPALLHSPGAPHGAGSPPLDLFQLCGDLERDGQGRSRGSPDPCLTRREGGRRRTGLRWQCGRAGGAGRWRWRRRQLGWGMKKRERKRPNTLGMHTSGGGGHCILQHALQ
jgi:hypothetical protein